jgi:subtilisin-like proprotein convertase family protein
MLVHPMNAFAMKSYSCHLSLRLIVSACLLILACAAPLSAAIYSANWNSGFTSNGAVPDGNAAGWSDSREVIIPSGELVTDVNVTINLSGGWNGDLYAYLSHPNSPDAAILLNRPGRTGANTFGYGDDVLFITLDDGAANGDVHFYASATGYQTAISNNSAFQPDGRSVSPLTVDGTEPRTALLSEFNGMNASSGNWTLYIADLASGDQTTVNAWGLSISTIPEPSAVLLVLLAGMAATSRRNQAAGRGYPSRTD